MGSLALRALLAATVERARAVGETVERFPVDPAVDGATSKRFPGVLPAFPNAGFSERGRVARDRAHVRLDAPPGPPPTPPLPDHGGC